ncbi:MAG: hypothetical protein ACYCZY_11430 [Lacisediminihabitans sp.]
MPMQYPKEVRDRAVRLVLDHRDDYDPKAVAVRGIAARLGGGPETLSKWALRADVDAGRERPLFGRSICHRIPLRADEDDQVESPRAPNAHPSSSFRTRPEQ